MKKFIPLMDFRGATMKIIVQKYGGTSVRDEGSRQHAKKHIQFALADQYKIVVVVSDMLQIHYFHLSMAQRVQ